MTAKPSNTVKVCDDWKSFFERVLGNAHDDVGDEIMRAP
jgi:hypothetical protein